MSLNLWELICSCPTLFIYFLFAPTQAETSNKSFQNVRRQTEAGATWRAVYASYWMGLLWGICFWVPHMTPPVLLQVNAML